jgi:hypothetical protein
MVSLLVISGSLAADAGVPEVARVLNPSKSLQFAIAGGLNFNLTTDPFVRKSEGAEVGAIAILPWHVWREDLALVTMRAQYTNYSTEIPLSGGNSSLKNAAHAQLRADYRQGFEHWGLNWTVGLGIMFPLHSAMLTPKGEFSFSEAEAYYPEAAGSISKINSSSAVYLRLGIDQQVLSDILIIGGGVELTALEWPKTTQRAYVNFYAGVRVW